MELNNKDKIIEKKFNECKYLMHKYKNNICCIIEKSDKCKNLSDLKKNKYIIPEDFTIGQINYIIRKQIFLDSKYSMFLYCNNKLLMSSSRLQDIYNENKDINGFINIKYCGENTFGNYDLTTLTSCCNV